MRRLEDTVKEMKEHADLADLEAQKFLDVCYLQSAVATSSQGKPTLYYMTLLAYAAVNKQKRMVKYLLDSGASKHCSLFVNSISKLSDPFRVLHRKQCFRNTFNTSTNVCFTVQLWRKN